MWMFWGCMNAPPVPSIDWPSEGAELEPGTIGVLAGVRDDHDAPEALTVELYLDGTRAEHALSGLGSVTSRVEVAEGPHTVTLVAADTTGAATRMSVGFQVVAGAVTAQTDTGGPLDDTGSPDPVDTAPPEVQDTAAVDTGDSAEPKPEPYVCGERFVAVDLGSVANTHHAEGPWTGDPTQSFSLPVGEQVWTLAEGCEVPFTLLGAKAEATMIATRGGTESYPSASFPERFEIPIGQVGTRLHLAGLTSAWADANFVGIAAKLSLVYASGEPDEHLLATTVHLDEWNKTSHSASADEVVKVYEDAVMSTHLDGLTLQLDTDRELVALVLEDDASVHTGSAERTSVALFALTLELAEEQGPRPRRPTLPP